MSELPDVEGFRKVLASCAQGKRVGGAFRTGSVVTAFAGRGQPMQPAMLVHACAAPPRCGESCRAIRESCAKSQ